MKLFILILSFFALLGFSKFSYSSDYDDLYYKLFGTTKPSRSIVQEVYLSIDNRNYVIIKSQVDDLNGTLNTVKKDQIEYELMPFLKDDSLDELKRIKNDEWLSINDLLNMGYSINYNHLKKTLSISIPVDKKKAEYISIVSHSPIEPLSKDLLLTPTNTLNGFINFSPVFDFTENNSTYTMQSSSSIAFRNWVLDSSHFLTENKHQPVLHLDKFNLIKQFEQNDTQLQLGYINDPSHSLYHQSSQLFGVFYKTTDYKQQRLGYVNKTVSVKIDSNSIVSVLINKKTYKENLKLKPGQYIFNNFPLRTGLSIIDIHIINTETKIKRVLTDFYISDTSLLQPGDVSYQLAAGYEYQTRPLRQKENIRKISLFSMRGMTNQLSVGGFIQNTDYLSSNQMAIGTISDYITRYGVFETEIALSKHKIPDNGSGLSFSQAYRSYPLNSAFFNTTQLNLKFVKKDSSFTGSKSSDSFNINANHRLSQKTYLSSSISFYSLGRRLQLSLSNIDNRLTTRLIVSLNEIKNQASDVMTRFSISYEFKKGTQKTTSKLEYYNDQLTGDYAYSNKSQSYSFKHQYHAPNSYNNSLVFRQKNFSSYYSQSKRKSYISDTVSHTLTLERFKLKNQVNFYDNDFNFNKLNIDFALAFVGKTIAITKPIESSFVMIKAPKELNSYVFDWGSFKTGPKKTGVMSTRSLYDPIKIQLKDTNYVSSDFQYEKLNYSIYPKYGSGLLIVIDHQKPISFKIKLLIQNKKALPFISGLIESDSTRHPFITNEHGIVDLLLTRGSYKIELFDAEHKEIIIDVTPALTNSVLPVLVTQINRESKAVDTPPTIQQPISVTANKSMAISKPLSNTIQTFSSSKATQNQLNQIVTFNITQTIVEKTNKKPKKQSKKIKYRPTVTYASLSQKTEFNEIVSKLKLVNLIKADMPLSYNQTVNRELFSVLATSILELMQESYFVSEKEPLAYLVKNKVLMNLHPKKPMKRAEVFVAISRIAGYSESRSQIPIPTNFFIDISQDHWCYQSTSYLISQTLISPSKYLYPNKLITAGELIKILINFPSVSKRLNDPSISNKDDY